MPNELTEDQKNEILEVLSTDEVEGGYGVEYDKAEDALRRAESDVTTWRQLQPELDADDIAERIYSHQEYWSD